ncbi:MAG: sigma-70 family RNA polymerase sigma factor [Rubrivivax sp.]
MPAHPLFADADADADAHHASGSDDALMRAWIGGEGEAFECLYRRHSGPLYRFVRRLLGAAASTRADEVFQDTWSRVIQARTRWSPQGASFRTWLFTIAQRLVIDVQRRSGRERSLDDDDAAAGWAPDGEPWQAWPAPPSSTVDATPGPAEQLFWRTAGARLLQCLDALPTAQRAVFLLHHEDGLSLADAAQALQLGFETAKSRLRYAMDKLRTCMGAYLPAAAGEEPQ